MVKVEFEQPVTENQRREFPSRTHRQSPTATTDATLQSNQKPRPVFNVTRQVRESLDQLTSVNNYNT